MKLWSYEIRGNNNDIVLKRDNGFMSENLAKEQASMEINVENIKDVYVKTFLAGEEALFLKLVTWKEDNTQFLVNVSSNQKALQLAVNANIKLDKRYISFSTPEYTEHVKTILDKNFYTVKSVDFSLLCNIFKKHILCIIDGVLVINPDSA